MLHTHFIPYSLKLSQNLLLFQPYHYNYIHLLHKKPTPSIICTLYRPLSIWSLSYASNKLN